MLRASSEGLADTATFALLSVIFFLITLAGYLSSAKQHLGIDVLEWGGTAFTWTDAASNPTKGTTVWPIGAADGEHFAPRKSTFMVNYRVDDLDAVLQSLRDEGCIVLEKTDDSEYGKFGWVMDPEGNKVELWQPPPGQ